LGLAKEGGWHIFYNFILFLSVGNVYNRPSVAVVVAVVDGVGVGPKRGFGPLQKVLIWQIRFQGLVAGSSFLPPKNHKLF
jgi:hypothetical protein